MLLQSHIAEADKVDVGAMLLIPANIADMTRILPYAEGKRWRDQLGRINPLDIGNGFSTFVDRRLEYATTQVANCERLVLPKPIPLGARANRSPSTDRHGSRGDRGGSASRGYSAGRSARVMGVMRDALSASRELRPRWTMEVPMCGREWLPGEAFSHAVRSLQEDDAPDAAGEGGGEAAVQTLLPPPGD